MESIRDFSDSNLGAIRTSLETGMNPNRQFFGGIALFHAAVDNVHDNVKVVRELINAGADVNLCTHLDLTPLHFAVYHRKLQVFRALLESGASTKAKDFLGRTCLHIAVSPTALFGSQIRIHSRRKSRIIDILLNHKDVDINAVDSNGDTALMVAVKNKKMKAAVQLLQYGANPSICNNVSDTPLHMAFAFGPNYIAEELLLCGASIYSVNKNGETPMDIFLTNNRLTSEYRNSILKLIAFKYDITDDLRRKFSEKRKFLVFSRFLKCCSEVDQMKNDIISGNITMHDFLWDCFDENDFKFLLLQIHKPVVEKLVRDTYSEYFIEIFQTIPEFSLFSILQMAACSRKRAKSNGKAEDLADLFSILDIIYLFSEYLLKIEIFCLIVALYDGKIPESLQDFHDRDFNEIYLNSVGYYI